MIDPENVLLRCPNGHELQAARSDLDKDLACPVCNVTFRPALTPVAGPGMPVTTGYAGASDLRYLSRPKYPAFTTWMIALWLITWSGLTASTIMEAISPMAQSPAAMRLQPGAMPMGLLRGMLGCVCMLCGLVALVMQFMWIYRIHKDARQYGQYDEISPGLALGLTFIPIFDQPWTAWTLLKLGRFAASGDRSNDPEAAAAVQIAKTCLVTGVIIFIMNCITAAMVLMLVGQAWSEAMRLHLDPSKPEFAQQIQQAQSSTSPVLSIASQLLQLAGTVVYAITVRRIEKSLYTRLGATPR